MKVDRIGVIGSADGSAAGENNAETPSKKGRKTKEVSPSPSPNPVADEDDDEAMNVKAELEETEEMFKTGCENPEEMFS